MRAGIAAAVLALAVAGAAAVVASAETQANGLPAYTNGYTTWSKINRRPVTKPGAHNGVKNVFQSKPKIGKAWPNGAVIVKSIDQAGGRRGLPEQVAVMRKVRGRWQWVEYTLSGSRYSVLASGSLCTSCHMQARSNDWVFTKR